MTQDKLDHYIEQELYHELRCLLGAATIWQINKNDTTGFDATVAMDSAFVHARNLFIFFAPTDEDKKNKNNMKATEYGLPATYKSKVYSDNKEALNRHLFHLNLKRLKPTNTKNSGHINTKVLTFANEILELWVKFENEQSSKRYYAALREARRKAIEDAQNDATGRIEPLFKLS